MYPKVSVIMPAYNAGQYVIQAINSILNQTFNDFEFIIIDDCSTDDTVEKIVSFKDSRIKLYQNSANLKLSETLNYGLDLAKGEYIARMDADDIAYPSRFQKQVSYLDDNGDIAAIGTAITRIDKNGFVGVRNVVTTNPALIRWRMHFSNQITHPTVMFRRSIITQNSLRYGQLPAWYKNKKNITDIKHLSEDYLLFGLISQKYLVSNIDEPLLYFREHADSVSNQHSGAQLRTACKVAKILADDIIDDDIPSNLIDLMYLKNSSHLTDNLKKTSMLIDRLYNAHENIYRLKGYELDIVSTDYLVRKSVLLSRHKFILFRLMGLFNLAIYKADKVEINMIIENILHGPIFIYMKKIRKKLWIILNTINKIEAER